MWVSTAQLDDALARLQTLKGAEAAARDLRIQCEEEIVAMVDGPQETGTMTIKGSILKCSIKFGKTYKANIAGLRGIDSDNLPLKQVPAKWALDTKAYEKLRIEDPGLWRKVALHVVVKASKPSLTLKV
jgi:hypothetical protein